MTVALGRHFAEARTRLVLLAILVICVVSAIYALLRMAWAVITSPQRAWRLAVSFDQLGNAAANGDPDETISSRAGKARKAGRLWGCVLCKVLDALDPGHCQRHMELDEGRRYAD